MRGVEQGATFTITVDGRPVARLGPVERPSFAPPEVLDPIVGIPPDLSLLDELRAGPGVDLTTAPWTGLSWEIPIT